MTVSANPEQPISELTVGELDELIANIVRRVLREETGNDAMLMDSESLPADFLATFGSWDDDRSADEIVAEIYAGRTVAEREISL